MTARDPVPFRSYLAADAGGGRLAVRRVAGERGVYPPHKHDYFQILVFLGPSPPVEIDLRTIRPRRGSVCCVAPMRAHRVRFEEATRCWVVTFDADVLRPGLTPATPLAVAVRRAPELTPFLHQGRADYRLDEDGLGRVEALLERMARDCGRRGTAAREASVAALVLVLAELCEAFEPLFAPAAAGAVSRAGERRLARVAAYLADTWRDGACLDGAAAAAGVTPTHLCHLLRRHTGRTFAAILEGLRLDEARDRLVHTDETIADIALSVGFSDEKYFHRRFRRAVGSTPGRYRAERRGPPPAG